MSASSRNNICWREYTVTVDAIRKQLPSRDKGSLALDRWTSMNILPIMSVIANCKD
jgi:hypothetical protein